MDFEKDNTMIGEYTFAEVKKAAEIVREATKFMFDNIDAADRDTKDEFVRTHMIITINDMMNGPLQKALSDKIIKYLEGKGAEKQQTVEAVPMASFGQSPLKS